ncbi:Endolytic murein transglycosylase [Gordonia insulae]|uniref:Endolytic murein transglycosylase n=1 Tax=Gordonia insulae TaxID=2420509 RepID=A0A3G8JH01_9ACTN|nr:Endolytic murein transglycosylase [Gordonia insulae]
MVLAVVLACMLALVVSVGFVGLRAFGVFENRKDYTDAAGTSDVIVDIPQNSTLMDFGRILEDNDVVGSVNAFVDAAGGQAMSGGYYKLRTQIPAATAVEMMTDGNEHRVGRMVVPEGLQLDDKKGVDGKTTPGIFQMIANATAVTVNGERIGADVPDLEKAAADATPEELGVPVWARPTVQELSGDHRRIEGLIAPGTWETIDPHHSPTQILHDLIAASALRFEQWGLLDTKESGLTPYQTLVAASVVEREVANADDFAKVARVILNRLEKDQRLEMDSTANYTADVTNIDVYGDAYQADNKWNTYRIKGLPVTPIGAVGERALTAVEHPTAGRWLYFVTIDREGTTLFANTFEEHKQNREKACENKLLSTGCS